MKTILTFLIVCGNSWQKCSFPFLDHMCTGNGEILDDARVVPETRPIGLAGDRGQMEYRRIRLNMLP